MGAPAESSIYIITLNEIVWGGVLVAVTLVMHGFGMLWTLRFTEAFTERFGKTSSLAASMSNIVLGTWIITTVHLSEVIMWTCFFQWNHCFPNFSTAGYYSLMEYTTLTSEYNLPDRWRLLGGIIGTAGLLTFAWSTAILLTLAQDFQNQQMQRLRERRNR